MRLVRYTYPSYRSPAPSFVGASSPWAGLETEIDRLFESAVTGGAGLGAASGFPVDLYEDKDHTYVRAELPGFSRENINVEMVDGYLSIAAIRKTPAGDGQPEEASSFSRSIAIADEVQEELVRAAYENGVLTVTLPKREEAKPRKITVAVK